jgi:hypothetical protein
LNIKEKRDKVMLREDLLKLIEALPPNCRIIGMGVDSGGYDAICNPKIEVVSDSGANLALVGHFETEEERNTWWKHVCNRFIIG